MSKKKRKLEPEILACVACGRESETFICRDCDIKTRDDNPDRRWNGISIEREMERRMRED